MLDKLLSIFGVHRMSMLLNISSQIVRSFENEFKEDHNAKNAAIDAVIELLQKHKDVGSKISA